MFSRPDRDLLGQAAALYEAYGAALREGRRGDIATAYDRAGARIIFNGVPRQETWADLDARYRGAGSRRPTSAGTRWRSGPVGRAHVLVTGGFRWQSAGQADTTHYQYTALLVAGRTRHSASPSSRRR